jgi:glycosyltransferase involved in cell wall biosynthesis
MSYRILMLAPTSFFGDYGCHVRILEETLALQRLGHKVLIVTYPRGRDIPGVNIERTIPAFWRIGYEVGSSRHKIALDVLLASRAVRAARRFKPNIIHAHLHEGALMGALVSRLFNAPLVFDFQGSLTAEMSDHHFLNPRGPFFKPMRALEKFIDHLPRKILTSAPHHARGLTQEFGVPPQTLCAVPDAVNAQWTRALSELEQRERKKHLARLRQFLGIPRTRKIVVYLGLLAQYQGVDLLLDAAAKILRRGLDAHFVIMGYPGAEKYAQRARELGILTRVSFPGRIPYEDAPVWLALGDVAVAPKLSASEGNGKILNYMALELPVVAFDTPVAREYLDEAGVYAPLGDVDAFAQQVEQLLRDLPRAQELGKRLRARAIEKFSWDATARKIEQVYAELLKQRAPALVPAQDLS